MISALWTSASGLMSHQIVVDTIGNNIANLNTHAFKRNVAQFQDLLYQEGDSIGEFGPDSLDTSTSSRTNISFGTGVKNASTNKVFSQGRLEPTGGELDLAIQSEGFFKVMLPNGTEAYTRDGSFRLDASRQIVTAQGYVLEPSIQIPEGAKDITIGKDGTITAKLVGEEGVFEEESVSEESVSEEDASEEESISVSEISEIGKIELYRIVNPAGMSAIGENLFVPTVNTGDITEMELDSSAITGIEQGFLEGSNIDIADEMTQLVIAQRSYQMNATALKNAEEMLAMATNIRG